MRRVPFAVATVCVVVGLGAGFAIGRTVRDGDRIVALQQRTTGDDSRFLAERAGALDRDTQSLLRFALVLEMSLYTDHGSYADVYTDLDGSGAADLGELEPSMTFAPGLVPASQGVIHVEVIDGMVYISAQSRSGNCFYISDDAIEGERFAYDPECGSADAQAYIPADSDWD